MYHNVLKLPFGVYFLEASLKSFHKNMKEAIKI